MIHIFKKSVNQIRADILKKVQIFFRINNQNIWMGPFKRDDETFLQCFIKHDIHKQQQSGNDCQPCFELAWIGHSFPGKRTGQNSQFLNTITESVKMRWGVLEGNCMFPGLGVSAASLLTATRGFQIAHFGVFGAFCKSFPIKL